MAKAKTKQPGAKPAKKRASRAVATSGLVEPGATSTSAQLPSASMRGPAPGMTTWCRFKAWLHQVFA